MTGTSVYTKTFTAGRTYSAECRKRKPSVPLILCSICYTGNMEKSRIFFVSVSLTNGSGFLRKSCRIICEFSLREACLFFFACFFFLQRGSSCGAFVFCLSFLFCVQRFFDCKTVLSLLFFRFSSAYSGPITASRFTFLSCADGT